MPFRPQAKTGQIGRDGRNAKRNALQRRIAPRLIIGRINRRIHAYQQIIIRPVENTIGVAQAVLETESVSAMVANYVSDTFDVDVEIPDYEHLERPLVEVFTLDSATCAACTYMLGAATAAKERFGTEIDMVEYKFTEKENIARCKKMGVKNLPSIYINGKLKFASIIPSREELDAAIKEVL